MSWNKPSRIKSDPPQTGVRGAVHADLEGAPQSHRYRPARFYSDDLSAPIECTFLLEDEIEKTSGRVINASATGLAIQVADAHRPYARGTTLSELVVSHRGTTLFEGTGTIVYQTDSHAGIRTNGLIDLRSVEVREALEGRGVLRRIASLDDQVHALPPEWRAAVGDVVALLENVRQALDEVEIEGQGRGAADRESETRLLRDILEEWSSLHLGKLQQLHFLSKGFDEGQLELGRMYAETLLAPLYLHGALYNRAATKPRGYAGDYLTMLLFTKEEPEGDTLFARFVDLVSKQHSLSTTALTRQNSVTENVLECLSRGGRRIVSLASGAATELGAVIDRIEPNGEEVDFILIDQDDEALAYSHGFLTKKVLENGLDPSLVRINGIHFSVKQILRPKTDEEFAILNNVLKGADFIYSVGLLDYLPDPIAERLIDSLYRLLGDKGQLFIGNLVEAEDSTWLMNFVLAWPLVWRTPKRMLALASGIDPEPSLVTVEADATEKCLFLEIHAP
jgi:hypothetical protein